MEGGQVKISLGNGKQGDPETDEFVMALPLTPRQPQTIKERVRLMFRNKEADLCYIVEDEVLHLTSGPIPNTNRPKGQPSGRTTGRPAELLTTSDAYKKLRTALDHWLSEVAGDKDTS
jgi:hypothetical protein